MRSKRSKNYIDPLGGTYLHGLRKGVNPHPPPHACEAVTRKRKQDSKMFIFVTYLAWSYKSLHDFAAGKERRKNCLAQLHFPVIIKKYFF